MIKKILGWILVPYIMVGILVKRKTQKTSFGILAGVITFLILVGISGVTDSGETANTQNTNSTKVEEKVAETTPTPEPTPTLSPEEIEKQNYQAWIDAQFSAWDGSHRDLVKLVKENMNDPKSFEHVETRYIDDGDGITVYMKFRGNNAFGGLVLNEVLAKAGYKTNTITIIANE